MATITKRATGYQAQIRRRGFPTVSKMFDTKREAEAWTRMNETQMDQGIYLDRSEADKPPWAKSFYATNERLHPSRNQPQMRSSE